MYEGCNTCAHSDNCRSDPSICEEYERDIDLFLQEVVARRIISAWNLVSDVELNMDESTLSVNLQVRDLLNRSDRFAATVGVKTLIEDIDAEMGFMAGRKTTVNIEAKCSIPDYWEG